MSNLVDSLKTDTAAEIGRVENYLISLRQFQVAIDPPRQKRKYTKRKKAPAAGSAPKRGPGRPPKIAGREYLSSYKITSITNTNKKAKKKPGRPRKKAI